MDKMDKKSVRGMLLTHWPAPRSGERPCELYWSPEDLRRYGFNPDDLNEIEVAEGVINDLVRERIFEVGIRKSDFLVLRRVR